MRRWTQPLPAEPDRGILSHVWTTSTCYKPLEIERRPFDFPIRFDLFFVVRGECGSEGLWYGHFRLRLALLHDLLEVVRDLGHVDDLEAVFRGEIPIVEHRHRCAVVG